VVHIYRPAGVPFRAAAAAAKGRPRWHDVTPAAPAGGQPSAPVQRQPPIRSPRTGSLPRSTEPRGPQTRAAPVERKPYSGGAPSPGINERNRQRREEQRAQREERQQARNEQRVRREERPRAEAPRREEHHPSNGGQRTAKPAKKDDRDAKERNKH
jgi:hypothetical protein